MQRPLQEEKALQYSDFLKDHSLVSAKDYITAHPGAGAVHVCRPFKIPYYVLSNCLCAGKIGQVVMPLSGPEAGRTVLLESFNYAHSDELLAAALTSALLNSKAPILIDEAVPLYPVWSLGNLWHWLFDSVPKVMVMEAAGYSGPYIINVMNKVMREGLELLGVGPQRMIHCEEAHIIRRLLLPQPLSREELLERHQPLLLAMRERMLDFCGVLEGGKNCFIRRIGTRRLGNEEEILDRLKKYDFSILVPEEHSLRDQIRFMSNADITLSPHGANTALAFFQKRGSVLIEFFGRGHINNTCNLAAIRLLKLLYVPITETVLANNVMHAPNFRPREPDADGLLDYSISSALVEAVLDNIVSARCGL